MPRIYALLVTLILSFPLQVTAESENVANANERKRIVLVCLQPCHEPEFTPLKLRKLFLGMPVKGGDRYLVPLINLSDPKLEDFFYQSVVAMSRKSFRAKQLLYQMRYALSPPRQFERKRKILAALQRTPGAVTFMWQRETRDLNKVKVLQTLWTERVHGH